MVKELFAGDVESRKLKRMIEEISSSDDVVDSELLLSLSVGNKKMAGESSSMLSCKTPKGHMSSPGFAPKLVENNAEQVIVPKQCEYSCKYCSKKFSTSQALGGHQNGHRRERALSKMEKDFDARAFGLGAHMFPYSAMPPHHPFGGPMMPLYYGANMPHHPMANMPTMPWLHVVPGYVNQGLHNSSISAQQFGMSNPWGIATEPPRHMDVGIGAQLNQVPSLDVGTTFAGSRLSGILGNLHARNQQLSSSKPNLSLNI